MALRDDSFAQIADDLDKHHSPDLTLPARNLGMSFVVIAFITMILIGIAVLFHLSALNSRLSSSEPEPSLRDTYISKAEDYEFRWELADFNSLTASQGMNGDLLDDVIAKFGKPSEVEDYSDPVLFFIYSDPLTGRMVTLDFKRYGDGEFYLQNKTFSHFPVPEEAQLHFSEDGQPMTRELVRELSDIVDFRTDDGHVIKDLLTLYEKPDTVAYTKDIYRDSLQLYYVLEETNDTVHLDFIKDGERFILERLWASFY